jgi:hypothetical protein
MSDPKTTVTQVRYVQGNRELIRDPAVVEEFDRLAAFLLGSLQGIGQRQVERDLEQGFDRLPTLEFMRPPLDPDGFALAIAATREAAYAAAIAAGLTTGQATAAADAAEAALRASQQDHAPGEGGEEGDGGTDSDQASAPPSRPPQYPPLGPDPGDPAVFEIAPVFTFFDIAYPFDVSFPADETSSYYISSVVPPGEYPGSSANSALVEFTTITIPPSDASAGVTIEWVRTGSAPTGPGTLLRDLLIDPTQDYGELPSTNQSLGYDVTFLGSISNTPSSTAHVVGVYTITYVTVS